jgi:hypothetical protein
MLISVSINLTDVIHAALLLHLAYAELEFLGVSRALLTMLNPENSFCQFVDHLEA